MGMVNKPQLQAWLLELHTGSLPFEDDDFEVRTYTELVDSDGIEKQTTKRTAMNRLQAKIQ